METICTFFLNYQQYIILLTICFFAGMAWRHHRLISRLFIIAASCLWVIYVYRYQIAVGWPTLDASGELSLRELFFDRLVTERRQRGLLGELRRNPLLERPLHVVARDCICFDRRFAAG